ncbi:unnamed protein product [Clonostachys rosea]|uniref:glucan endo-1,6-beta-glucosidase n=1 Tax=Bionectria ochroleuca TaxID=29856 RepID=A0ABY6UBE6_BIOOC|nr:unnamed protein product [Clonostachys rosea]
MLSKFAATALAASTFASVAHAWLPGHKIRGVNIGSLFVFEPWIDSSEWSRIGCSGQKSEFDCVMNIGQEAADKGFQSHWDEWITTTDLDEMKSYGLNTVRIPLGYWLKEDLVDKSEHFPKGGIDKLTSFVGAASDRGFYIILDFHGAPGAQEPNQPFTGQYNPNADFYNDYNYGRALEWLKWITEIKHTKNEYRNVGMIEVLNEPTNWDNKVDSLRSNYYVKAYNAIRDVEKSLGVTPNNYVHIQMMSSLWGSGNPTEFLSDTTFTAFDDHRYLKWDGSVAVNKQSYISTSCADDRKAESPLFIGEWSLSVPDNVENTDEWKPANDPDFYRKWFAAQIQTYERSTEGWIFWTWKANLNDPRWSYKDAVEAGIIGKDLESVLKSQVC